MTRLIGIGVSAGTAAGRTVVVGSAPGVDKHEAPSTDPEADTAAIKAAMNSVAEDLRERAATADETAQPILLATAQLAQDRALIKAATKRLRAGAGITQAVDEAVAEYTAKLKKLGGYMAERAADLNDIRDRVIADLRGLPMPGVPALSSPAILLAQDLAPAETATLDREKVLGIITAQGGPTSHTAILAAQYSIPAVVGLGQLPQAEQIALDGSTGEVIPNPSEEEIEEFCERQQRREQLLASTRGRGETADGHPVDLLVNIGSAEEAEQLEESAGTGLFRTEFLFLDREDAPSLVEQTETYARVMRAFGQARVVVRTLDAGADKPLAFADLGEEENPALGRRGLRLSQARPELLDTQLEALAAAWKETGQQADLRVMAPMVSTLDEALWFAKKARSYDLPKVGIMVEVPAAAIRASELLAEVDFCSIGTNDLSQYTLAADRMQSALAGLLNPWQPAVLELIRLVCNGGVATGKPVGVCGEAGGDPLLALVLVGLGVSSLSMAAGKLPAVRAALAMHDLDTCRQMAAYAVDAPSAKDAQAAVEKLVHPRMKDLR